MDAAQLDYDRTKSKILRLAQMQYDCCTWKGRQHIAFSSLMPTAARVFEEIPPLNGKPRMKYSCQQTEQTFLSPLKGECPGLP